MSERMVIGRGAERAVYESSKYNYTLTYDSAEWEHYIGDETPDDEYDFACFGNGVGIVCLSSNPAYDADKLTDCVEDYGVWLETAEGVSDVEPRGERGYDGDDDDRAWGAYVSTFENEDEEETDYVLDFECRWLGNVAVVVIHDVEVDFYDDQIEAREELVEGLDTDSGHREAPQPPRV